jgi:hypothetical protein
VAFESLEEICVLDFLSFHAPCLPGAFGRKDDTFPELARMPESIQNGFSKRKTLEPYLSWNVPAVKFVSREEGILGLDSTNYFYDVILVPTYMGSLR